MKAVSTEKGQGWMNPNGNWNRNSKTLVVGSAGCRQCGKSGHSPAICWAKDAKCNNGGRQGHYRSVSQQPKKNLHKKSGHSSKTQKKKATQVESGS